jgi:hypothetical protein
MKVQLETGLDSRLELLPCCDRAKDDEGCMPAVRCSYYHLPCFLVLSFLNKNVVVLDVLRHHQVLMVSWRFSLL